MNRQAEQFDAAELEHIRLSHKHEPGCGCPFDPAPSEAVDWQDIAKADPAYEKWLDSLNSLPF